MADGGVRGGLTGESVRMVNSIASVPVLVTVTRKTTSKSSVATNFPSKFNVILEHRANSTYSPQLIQRTTNDSAF